jgi:hypothetical protein
MQACRPWTITTEGVAGPSSRQTVLVLRVDVHE